MKIGIEELVSKMREYWRMAPYKERLLWKSVRNGAIALIAIWWIAHWMVAMTGMHETYWKFVVGFGIPVAIVTGWLKYDFDKDREKYQ